MSWYHLAAAPRAHNIPKRIQSLIKNTLCSADQLGMLKLNLCCQLFFRDCVFASSAWGSDSLWVKELRLAVCDPLQTLTSRPRRNRRSPALRAAFQETLITPANFILPLFVHEGMVQPGSFYCLLQAFKRSYDMASFEMTSLFLWQDYSLVSLLLRYCSMIRNAGEQNTPIGAMPGCYRLGWRHGLIDEVGCLESMLLQRLESLCLWLCAWAVSSQWCICRCTKPGMWVWTVLCSSQKCLMH
jgi:hypothetical protein